MWKGMNALIYKKGFEIVRCMRSETFNFWKNTNNNEMGRLGMSESVKLFMNSLWSYHSDSVPRIVKGMRLEEGVVASLLCNGGKRDYLVRNSVVQVPVESITGKHLLICCFKVPLPKSQDTRARNFCRAMIATYSHLVNDGKDFEMVVVAANTAADDEEAFNRFFDDFPCLAIPFWDTEARDFVSKSLGLTDIERDYAALVLDRDHMVLQTDGECFFRYGVIGYPYSDHHLAALRNEFVDIRRRLEYVKVIGGQVITSPRPVSLVELLGSDVLLSQHGTGQKMYSSELAKKKCVALYLCGNADFPCTLLDLQNRCLRKNLEFEVVFVPMQFLEYTALVHDSSSWWMMPLGDSEGEAGCRLRSIAGQYLMDEVIILADGGTCGNLDARDFYVRLASSMEHYPFTRKTSLEKIFCRLRSITLNSLLDVDGWNLVSPGFTVSVAVSELKGRNVLLFLDYYDGITKGGAAYESVLECYEQMQKDYPNSKVVFVPLDGEAPENAQFPCPALPWLSLPYYAASLCRELIWGLFPGGFPEPWLFTFGEDGLIRSTNAWPRLGDNVSLFADTLMQDIYDDLDSYLFL